MWIWCISRHSLNLMRNCTGNQCNCASARVNNRKLEELGETATISRGNMDPTQFLRYALSCKGKNFCKIFLYLHHDPNQHQNWMPCWLWEVPPSTKCHKNSLSTSLELSAKFVKLPYPTMVKNSFKQVPYLTVPAPKVLKTQGFTMPFHSIIPVDHSIVYSPTGTLEKDIPIWGICAWHLLRKRLNQFFYQLHSTMAGSLHSHKMLWNVHNRQIPNYLRLFFQNNSRTFSVCFWWNSRTFQGWLSIQGQHMNPVICIMISITTKV